MNRKSKMTHIYSVDQATTYHIPTDKTLETYKNKNQIKI